MAIDIRTHTLIHEKILPPCHATTAFLTLSSCGLYRDWRGFRPAQQVSQSPDDSEQRKCDTLRITGFYSTETEGYVAASQDSSFWVAAKKEQTANFDIVRQRTTVQNSRHLYLTYVLRLQSFSRSARAPCWSHRSVVRQSSSIEYWQRASRAVALTWMSH